MTTLNANTIKPAGSTLTLGASGDTIVANDDVKVKVEVGDSVTVIVQPWENGNVEVNGDV